MMTPTREKTLCLYCGCYMSGNPMVFVTRFSVCSSCMDSCVREGNLRETEESLDLAENRKDSGGE